MAENFFKGKNAEQLIKELAILHVAPGSHLADAISAQIQSHLVNRLSIAIDQATAGLVRQGISLEQCVEGAKNNFVTESHSLRESMGGIRSSLETFRKSTEKSSKALTTATYVLAGVAFIQAVIFAFQWFK
jgi:CHAD domain-containing protein